MEHTISAAQFFAVQFLIRVTMTIALDPSAIAGENPLNTLLSYGLAMVLGAGLAVPVWLLHRQPGVAFGEQARKALGPLGRVVGLFYILYFVAANALSLGAFLELLEKRLHPEFPLVLILAAVVAVAAYGAWRGLETIARAGACLCVLVLAGTALLFGTAAGRFQWENLQPLGDAPALRGAAVFLSRTSLFAEMAVLLPYVRGRRGLGFALWSLGTTVFVAALTLLLAGCRADRGRAAHVRRHPGLPRLHVGKPVGSGVPPAAGARVRRAMDGRAAASSGHGALRLPGVRCLPGREPPALGYRPRRPWHGRPRPVGCVLQRCTVCLSGQ